ncbi:hypothetical protein J2785_000992 [Burkholderia ambifaria]|nr:hypothetical protein [Burkholderia ambifaria]
MRVGTTHAGKFVSCAKPSKVESNQQALSAPYPADDASAGEPAYISSGRWRTTHAVIRFLPVEAASMQIHFTNEKPEYSGRDLMLGFTALVNGERVQCQITAEALEDHFGAASPRFEDMVGAFDQHRDRIEAAARRLLSETRAQCVTLRSGYVRFYEANWR